MPALVAQDLFTPRQNDRWVRSRLLPILGDTRLLWMANPGDGATGQTRETSTGRVVTWDASVAARVSRLGRGWQQSFNGTTQFGSIPDAATLSFGNSTTDSSFSAVVLANVTDTAASREMVGKNAAANVEWDFRINPGDTLGLFLTDQSVPATPSCSSNAAITQGAFALFGATYDVTLGSGATAATGVTLYQSGAAIASTATNAGTYVAMEDLTSDVEIGACVGGTAIPFSGSLALVAVCQKALSAADHAAIAALCRRFYGAA